MRTREVSVFIDESGSYEHDRQSSRYYLVCMIFHDQDIDITADIACTLELARAKLLSNEGLSESEMVFFGGVKKFKKNYLKLLDRRRID